MWLHQYLEKYYYYGPPNHDMAQFRNFGIYLPFRGNSMIVVFFYEPRRELKFFKNRDMVTKHLEALLPILQTKLGSPDFVQAFDDGTGTFTNHVYEWTKTATATFGDMAGYGTVHKCLMVEHLASRVTKFELHLEVSPFL